MSTPQKFTDYYALLKVDRKASLAAIKQSYRKLARQLHPDLNPGNEAAAEQFKAVNEAYQVLSNPATRRHYDRYGQHPKPAQKGYAATSYPGRRQNDDFEETEFGRHGTFEDLIGDILKRYG